MFDVNPSSDTDFIGVRANVLLKPTSCPKLLEEIEALEVEFAKIPEAIADTTAHIKLYKEQKNLLK